ncbi:MAG TPA: hypothetical protein VL242_12660 [Sorangium sp.]|nr:hypothetical protein [Sorangium sp.]
MPAEAEWHDAAAGGDEQRPYPWSDLASDGKADTSHAVCMAAPGTGLPPARVRSVISSRSGRDRRRGMRGGSRRLGRERVGVGPGLARSLPGRV